MVLINYGKERGKSERHRTLKVIDATCSGPGQTKRIFVPQVIRSKGTRRLWHGANCQPLTWRQVLHVKQFILALFILQFPSGHLRASSMEFAMINT